MKDVFSSTSMLTRGILAVSRWLSLVAVGLALVAPQATAVTFKAGLENTEWQLEPSKFGCKFRQPIPFYGFANFFKQAGEELVFYLETHHNQMAEGQAALVVEAPEWMSNALTSDLGFARVLDRKYPVIVKFPRADRMLAELDNGMAPTLTRTAKYQSDQIRVQLSPVNFRNFYNDYLACISGLLPVNFNQVERVSVLFRSGQEGLTDINRKELERIALYVKEDPKVIGVYVDGHTDDIGTRYHNRRLSEKRSELVSDFLVAQGVDPDLLITRYHGERYPVASNSTASGRAQNRRVTIRLERIFGDDDDPLGRHPIFE